jgi:hypothetical protein
VNPTEKKSSPLLFGIYSDICNCIDGVLKIGDSRGTFMVRRLMKYSDQQKYVLMFLAQIGPEVETHKSILDGSDGFFDTLFFGKKQVTAPNQEDQKIKKELSIMIGDTSLREYYLLHNELYFWNGAQVPEGQSLSPYRIQMRYAGSPLVKIFTSNNFLFH